MTRETAIKGLKAFRREFSGYEPNEEMFDMAIKALEQEPTTKNDLGVDAVSRAEVLKLMQDNWHTHNGDWAMQESMDDIRALSSVTPQEPRKGHWIWCVGSHKCSNCEEYTCFSHEKLLRYCPNCGAKMESEDT